VRGRRITAQAWECKKTAGSVNTARDSHKSRSLQLAAPQWLSVHPWASGMQEAAHHISCPSTCTFSF